MLRRARVKWLPWVLINRNVRDNFLNSIPTVNTEADFIRQFLILPLAPPYKHYPGREQFSRGIHTHLWWSGFLQGRIWACAKNGWIHCTSFIQSITYKYLFCFVFSSKLKTSTEFKLTSQTGSGKQLLCVASFAKLEIRMSSCESWGTPTLYPC